MSEPDRSSRQAVPTSRRSPTERLLAVLRQPDVDRAHWMFRELRDEYVERPHGARTVIEAARRLRERGTFSDDAVAYIAACLFGPLAFRCWRDDPEVCRLKDEVSVLTAAYVARGDAAVLEQSPPELAALWAAIEARMQALKPQRMREEGCVDLATLWEKDRSEFRRRVRRGGVELWGPDLMLDELPEQLFLDE